MKIWIAALLLLMLIPAPAMGLSNGILDRFLIQDRADFGTTVYLVLSMTGRITEQGSVDEAMEIIRNGNWKIVLQQPGEAITLGGFALLLMQVFDKPGGLFYSLFPCRRYAARELVSLGLSVGKTNPSATLTPFEVMFALGKIGEETQ